MSLLELQVLIIDGIVVFSRNPLVNKTVYFLIFPLNLSLFVQYTILSKEVFMKKLFFFSCVVFLLSSSLVCLDDSGDNDGGDGGDDGLGSGSGSVVIWNVVASPTESEQISLKNTGGDYVDISGWFLGDKNDPDAYKIPQSSGISAGGVVTFVRSTLGFQINDTGEILYLKDSAGTLVDKWPD